MPVRNNVDARFIIYGLLLLSSHPVLIIFEAHEKTSTTSIFVSSLRPSYNYLASLRIGNRQDDIPSIDKRIHFGLPLRVVGNRNSLDKFHRLNEHDGDEGSNDPSVITFEKKLDNNRGMSMSLFVTYLTVMGAKCALPSTLSLLSSPQSGLAHYSTSSSRQDVISRLLYFSTLSVAAGKLLLGPFIDSLGGVVSLQIALLTLLLSLGSVGFGSVTCPTLTAFAGYWMVVDFAFSSCWAACVKTIRDYTDEKDWSNEIGRLAMAARIGNSISFAFFAWLLQTASDPRSGANFGSGNAQVVDTSWRLVFRASSAIQLIPLMMLSYFQKKTKTVGDDTRREDNQRDMVQTHQVTTKRSLEVLVEQSRAPEFWLHLLSRSILMVLISFLLFIPTYMTQCFQMTPASSSRVGSLFAFGCFLSVLTLAEKACPPSIVESKESVKIRSISAHNRKSWALMCFQGVVSICLSLQIGFLYNWIPSSPFMGSFLVFLWGFSIAIPFYLPASMFALKRGGKDGSATIADAFDVCGFGLLAVFNAAVARIMNLSGANRKALWSPIFTWMLGGSIVSMVSLFFALRFEVERSYSHSPSSKESQIL